MGLLIIAGLSLGAVQTRVLEWLRWYRLLPASLAQRLNTTPIHFS
jgi:hypothetical protein